MSDTLHESDPDIVLVLAAYAAFARGDMVAAVDNMHPDVEWIGPLEMPNGGAHHGRAAVAAYLRASRDSWYELRSMPLARRVDDRIVVEHHLKGTLVDGEAHQLTVADVFTVRDGQVVHMQAYADPADVPG